MAISGDREAVRREVAAVLKEYGLEPPQPQPSALSDDEQRRAHEIAKQIVNTQFDSSQLANLDSNLIGEISNIVRQMMSSAPSESQHALEEDNPYYTPFASPIVRDAG